MEEYSRTTLPNYSLYRSKLLDYADLCGLIVEYRDIDGCDSYYDYTTEKIVLDEKFDHCEEIATLLHELGHYKDDMINPALSRSDLVNEAHQKFNEGERLARKEKLALLLSERRAWTYGRELAKELKIPLGKWWRYERAYSGRLYRMYGK